MNEKQKELQSQRLALEQQVWDANRKLWDVKASCTEHVIQRGRTVFSPGKGRVVNTHEGLPDNWNDGSYSVFCAICDKEFGWYCPKNPKGYCEYPEENDTCIHCGEPDERK